MALDPATLPRPSATDEPAAPLGGTRSQAMQRLQVGMFGLASMVLLVGLASIIDTNREQNEAAVVVPEAGPGTVAPAQASPVSDPLADAGVVPDMPAAPAPPTPPSGNGNAQPAIDP